MNLIVGLGNPGGKYSSTRHNIGFMVVEHVVKDLVSVGENWEEDKSTNALIFKKGDLIFIKPQTYMNASGIAVGKLFNFYKITPDHLWVIHDDIDLPLGKIRIRIGGASAGHHGVDSIIKNIGKENFVRFRLGVGKGKLEEKGNSDHNIKRHEVIKYVISKFFRNEEGEVRKLVKHAAKAVELALHKGVDKAMNQYN
jgi:peptidyl-tRNA hydrolase, PTH1 family